ncbi:tripartite tricarboxylate transporter substrate binding protein [Cupriavidus necator]|uniref:Tripartite tricarboxylate transporter substrate binding protein n=1 Tax=Cupriavidus necator TaxID=106590 RepID=A0A367PM68_CUPNE|nr:tripartite tricarboxylate transporter substrate binding protein [Cupriavidus necator]QQX85930.1 tripartite tricarboxylate transporter substrate binding protein [Cupriavidus necator]RCJ08096.1 tripartite tricarboxylate transporter substrate binding protein [Cupriavidus necator]
MKHLFSALAAGAFAFGATMPGIAGALEFPAKPVRIIVPYPPGGTTDMVARLIGEQLATQWKQSVVVDNRPGAGGIVGTGTAAKSTADGYTLLMGSVGEFGINPALYKKLPYDADADFAPVAMVARVPNVVVLSPAFAERARVQTLPEFIAYLKANPKRVNMASAGNGTSTHLAGELFQRMTGTEMSHVAYKGSSPAISDLMGGSVDVMFDNLPASLPFIRSGKLKPLAVTTPARSSALPNVPTVAAAGPVPGFDASPWFGLLAPRGVPTAVAQKISQDLTRVLSEPGVQAKMRELGAEPAPSTPEAFAEVLKKDRQKWGEIVRLSGASVD